MFVKILNSLNYKDLKFNTNKLKFNTTLFISYFTGGYKISKNHKQLINP